MFKQTIDARYAIAQPVTPATGSNAIPINNTRQEPLQPPPDIPSSAFITESYFLQCEPVVKNHVIVTVEDSSDEDYQPDVNAVTRSKAKIAIISNPEPKPDPTPSTLSRLIEAPPKESTVEAKKPPAFTYESKAATPDTIQRVFKSILDVTVPHITVVDLLAISPKLRKEAINHCRTHRVPTPTTALSTNTTTSNSTSPPQVEHVTPLREIRVTLNGIHSELGLLDEGSEIVVI
ncbi:hypothetical protein BDR06DRAFT_1032890 [Suillus hirtellus]|nr:hypothetical protein BDR06DRAFT_1032890 [Suillus hirtellus]